MRSLFWNECHKLWTNRLFLLLLSLLLVISGVVCWRTQVKNPFGNVQDKVECYLEAYALAPQETENSIRARIDIVNAYNEKQFAADRGEISQDEVIITDEIRAALESNAADNRFISFLDKTRSYKAGIQHIIDSSHSLYDDYLLSGHQKTDFIVRYQVGVVTQYSRLLSHRTSLPIEPVYGWDTAMKTSGFVIFYLSALLLCGSLLLMPEKAGMMPLLRSARRGRLHTVTAKLATGALAAIVLAILFTVSNFCLIVARTGLRGAMLPLQSALPTAPYATTVLGGFLLQLLLRSLVGICFVWFVLLISFPMRRYVTLLGIGGSVIALSYGIQIWGRSHPYHVLRQLNLLNLMDSSDALTRWSAFHLGNFCIDVTKIVFPLLSCIAIVLFLFACVFFALRTSFLQSGSPMTGRFKRIVIGAIAQIRHHIPHRRSISIRGCSILGWEARKLWYQRLTPFLLLLLVIGQWYGIGTYYAENETYTDAVYYKYMTLLEGSFDEQTMQVYNEKKQALSDIVELSFIKEELYANGEITQEELRAAIREANLAEQEIRALERVDEKLYYLNELYIAGESPYVIYDTGWKLFLERGADDVLATFVILTFATLFAEEYFTGFAVLLSSTPRGRRKTFNSKMLLCISVSALLTLITQTAGLSVLSKHYHLPAITSLAKSLFGLEMLQGSILRVVVTVTIIRLLGMTLLSMFVSAMSKLTRSVLATATLSALCIFLSRLLHLFEVENLDAFLPDQLLRGLPALTSPTVMASAAFFGGCTLLLVFIASYQDNDKRRKL